MTINVYSLIKYLLYWNSKILKDKLNVNNLFDLRKTEIKVQGNTISANNKNENEIKLL